jgi:glycosyltransferase involved in cell wall biosynthesis
VNTQSTSLAVPEEDRPIGSVAGAPEGRPAKRPRLLVFAYACEPDRGSEPGAGWGLVRSLATFADCTVLVGPEHVPAIRRWELTHADGALEFVEVRERWWTPPSRRHRLTKFVLYLVWLRRARETGMQLHGRTPFDAVCHATYSTYWLPSPAVEYGVPCIWGPVGGAVTTPLPLWTMLGWRGIAGEVLDLVVVRACSAWPGTRRTWRQALVPVIQNETTLERLPADVRRRATVLNHALFTQIPAVPLGERERYCLFVGALESRKGARLALHALTHANAEVELRIVGEGPDRADLESLARRLGVWSRVRFLGRAPRNEVLRLLSEAAAVVFTGLREEGGIALAEAMLVGAPVIVLAHGGAGTIARSASDSSRVALITPGDPVSTARRIGDAMTRFSEDRSVRTGPTLDVAEARRRLRVAVEEACRGVPA